MLKRERSTLVLLAMYFATKFLPSACQFYFTSTNTAQLYTLIAARDAQNKLTPVQGFANGDYFENI